MIQGPVIRFRFLFGSGIAANLFGLGFSAVSTLAIARLLGASGRGQVAVLTVISSYLVVSLSLSLDAGVLHVGRRFPSVDHLLNRIIALLAVLTLVSILSLSVFGYFFADRSLGTVTILVYGVGYGIPVAVVPLTAIERLRDRHHSAMWWPSLVLGAQQASGLIWLVFDASVGSYIFGSAIGGLIATMVFLFYARPRKPSRPRRDSESETSIKNLVMYSISGHVGVILYLLCMRLPIVLAGLYLGDQAAGVYSVAVALAEVCLLVTTSQLGFVLAMATKHPDDFTPLRRQLKLSAVLTAGIMALLLVVSAWVPTALGRDFSETSKIIIAMSPGVVVHGLWRLAAYDLVARGQARLRNISAAWGAIAAVGGGAAAVHWGDVQSLAWSSTITYGVMFVSLVLGFRRRAR